MSESIEIRKALDFWPGDYIQIREGGRYAGAVGQIEDIQPGSKGGLMYVVRLVIRGEIVFATLSHRSMVFIRHEEE